MSAGNIPLPKTTCHFIKNSSCAPAKAAKNMLLYWGMFTAGFIIGAILAYGLFGQKEPEEERGYKGVSGEIKDNKGIIQNA